LRALLEILYARAGDAMWNAPASQQRRDARSNGLALAVTLRATLVRSDGRRPSSACARFAVVPLRSMRTFYRVSLPRLELTLPNLRTA